MSRKLITPDRLAADKGITFTAAWLRRLESRGQFPARVRLVPGGRRFAWYEDEIDQWIEERERECAPAEAIGG